MLTFQCYQCGKILISKEDFKKHTKTNTGTCLTCLENGVNQKLKNVCEMANHTKQHDRANVARESKKTKLQVTNNERQEKDLKKTLRTPFVFKPFTYFADPAWDAASPSHPHPREDKSKKLEKRVYICLEKTELLDLRKTSLEGGPKKKLEEYEEHY